ncbi:putative polyamine oxidase 5 [Nymphaea thermarum]|nr:putative polyamine oxidase 5 [Nymphaea thermarum]
MVVARKPRIVIIGAGMAGLAAANRLYAHAGSANLFELSIVEASDRIGGRIYSSEFGGDRVEVGATWIHGIGGSPVYNIAQQAQALHSEVPWERMDGYPDMEITITEDGSTADPSLLSSISMLYRGLMDFAGERKIFNDTGGDHKIRIAVMAAERCRSNGFSKNGVSIGSFLRCGLDLYWSSMDTEAQKDRRKIEEDVFAMHENTERTYTSADDLTELDFEAECEYREFPDEEITIAKGYSTVVHSLASILPSGCIQLGRKVDKVVWTKDPTELAKDSHYPVSVWCSDGSVIFADHVIVTVSLGVLKAETVTNSAGMFSPPLPLFKKEAISKLGFGVVNKLFLQLEPSVSVDDGEGFPSVQMVFDQKKLREKQNHDCEIPWWIKKTVSFCPIHKNSNVVLSWFAGKEALEMESLSDDEIIDGVSRTLSCLTLNSHKQCLKENERKLGKIRNAKIAKLLRSRWGTDPLFRGSYSYVAVGSSGEDMDLLAEPLPKMPRDNYVLSGSPLQLLFAGEATHRTHYSTTHGAYFSGIREASRLLQHYGWAGAP